MKIRKGEAYSEVQGCISGTQYKKSGKILELTGSPYDDSKLNAFLDSTNQHIMQRFEHMRQSPFHEFEIFDCRNHPHSDVSLAAYGWDELGVLLSFFSSVLTEEEQTAIPHEWPAFIASVKARKRTKMAHEILSDLLASDQEGIRNLLILIRIMVTLSPSSASVERGFSQMKALKSAKRSRMQKQYSLGIDAHQPHEARHERVWSPARCEKVAHSQKKTGFPRLSDDEIPGLFQDFSRT